jgi:hypothetical protein
MTKVKEPMEVCWCRYIAYNSTNRALASAAFGGEFTKVERLWLSPKDDTSQENPQVTDDLSPLQRFIQEKHPYRPWDPIGEVRSLAIRIVNDIVVSAARENDHASLSCIAEKGSTDDDDRTKAIL